MDKLGTSPLQIVLGIKGGSGFGYCTHPIVIVAKLNGNKIESNILQPSSELEFETDFIWETEKKHLRRLRTGNTPLKIECLSILNKQRRDRLGYIILSLKQAQIITKDSQIEVTETWHKLLGLRPEAKNHSPGLSLTFRVQEGGCVHDLPQVEKENNLYLGMGDAKNTQLETNSEKENLIEIGCGDECTQVFNLSVLFTSVAYLNLLRIPGNQSPMKLEFAIFGSTFNSKNLAASGEPVELHENIVITLKSKLQILYAYFKEFPILTFKLNQGEESAGSTSMNLAHLIPTEDFEQFKNSFAKNEVTIQEKIYFYVEDAIEENPESPKPYVEVTVKFAFKGYIPSQPQIKRMNSELASGDAGTEKTNKKPIPPISKPIDSVSPKGPNTLPNPVSSVPLMVEKREPEPKGITAAFESEKYEPRHNTDPCATNLMQNQLEGESVMYKDVARDNVLKMCEELEDWKERQQEIFKFELKRKSDRHIQKLSSEWLKRQKEIEEDFLKRMEQCRTLTETLTEASRELAARTELVMEKEKELSIAQEELDRQYTSKFQDLREASRRHQVDMEHKMTLIRTEKTELLARLEAMEREKDRLKQEKEMQKDELTREQTAALMIDMKCLEEKLEAALESKAFFKEQWGRAVREIHRLKAEQQEQLRLQIERNKMELEKIGLMETISHGEKELMEDQTAIQNLRSQLLHFQGTKNNDKNLNMYQGLNRKHYSDFYPNKSDFIESETPLSL